MGNVSLMGWDADAEVWRRVLVNADGKLIIDPSEIFEDPPTDGEAGKAPTSNWAYDHKADASAHHVKYTDAEARTAVGYNGTKYWSCGGIHFDGENPATDNLTKKTDGYLIINADSINVVADVFLPHGAVITSIIVFGNAAAATKTWHLGRVTLSGGVWQQMAEANINTADSTIAEATVDNTTYSYHFICDVMVTSDRIYGAKITYTI